MQDFPAQTNLIFLAVHLKDGVDALPVDLVARGMPPDALCKMSSEDGGAAHVLEAELTDVELGKPCVLLRVRGRVPGVELEAAKLQLLDGALAGITQAALLLREREKNV